MTTQPRPQTLKEAVDQAWATQQQRVTELEQQQEQARQQRRQALIAEFKLPFDEETIALLPPLTYDFFGKRNYSYDDREIPVACFTHAGLLFKIWQSDESHTSYTWKICAYSLADIQASEESGKEDYSFLYEADFHVYPNKSWMGYCSPAQLGESLLLSIHNAIERLASEKRWAEEPSQEQPTTFLLSLNAEQAQALEGMADWLVNTDMFLQGYIGRWAKGVQSRTTDEGTEWLIWEEQEPAPENYIALEAKAINQWSSNKPLPCGFYQLDRKAALRAIEHGILYHGINWVDGLADGDMINTALQMAILGKKRYC